MTSALDALQRIVAQAAPEDLSASVRPEVMAGVERTTEGRPEKRQNAYGRHCLNCSGPLPGRSNPGSQRKFCSPRCRREHWERTHPRMGDGAVNL